MSAYSILKKSVLLFSSCFLLSTMGKAQGNLPYSDDKLLHFGFSLGINMMDFGVENNFKEIDGNIYQASVTSLQPGFSVGVISDLRLSRYFNLRFCPALHFSERSLTYSVNGIEEEQKQNIFSVPLTIPLHIKYSAERLGNFRPYLLAGGGVNLDFGRNTEKAILLKPFDAFIEFGVGCNIYFPFFKLAPELRFAFGTNNVLTPLDQREVGFLPEKDKAYTAALNRLRNRMLTLTFNFE